MTQALINSLNIIKETNVDLNVNRSKSAGMDFGKIFETKTNAYEKRVDDVKPKEMSEKKTENLNPRTEKINNQVKEENKISDNKNDKTVADNSEKTPKTEHNIITKESNDTKKQLNGDIRKSDSDEKNDSETITDEEDKETITENDEEASDSAITDEEIEDAEETTITEEDPTMYNELITLEDPTVLLMLQSQIQKTLTINDQNEKADVSENSVNANQSSASGNSTDTETNNNTEVFKQLDAQLKKGADIVNKSSAEITRSNPANHKSSNVLNENVIKELNVEVVSSQTADAEGSMEGFMQNQSPQEQTARIMIQGDIKYESVASETAKNISQAKTTTVSPGRIIEQISKQLEGMFNNSKLNMVLNPGTLGKLNLQLINSKDGILAQFTVTTQEARDILMKGLSGLKETLLAQGVNVDNVLVKLENSESESETDYTEQEGSRGGYKRQGEKRQKEDGKNFEEMMFNLENENNNV